MCFKIILLMNVSSRKFSRLPDTKFTRSETMWFLYVRFLQKSCLSKMYNEADFIDSVPCNIAFFLKICCVWPLIMRLYAFGIFLTDTYSINLSFLNWNRYYYIHKTPPGGNNQTFLRKCLPLDLRNIYLKFYSDPFNGKGAIRLRISTGLIVNILQINFIQMQNWVVLLKNRHVKMSFRCNQV